MFQTKSTAEVADALEIGRRTLQNWLQSDLLDAESKPGTGRHRRLSLRDALSIALMREFQRCTGHSPSPRLKGAMEFAWDISGTRKYRDSVVVVTHVSSSSEIVSEKKMKDTTGWTAVLLSADEWLEGISPLEKTVSIIPLRPLHELVCRLFEAETL